EYPPYDGWYNNRAHPEWGTVDGPLTRSLPSHYADGTYAPSGGERPNPRTISQNTMAGNTGMGSSTNRTALLVFFGQQVVEEILDAQRPGCPPEYFNIKIPKGDPLYDANGTGEVEIPFLRSRYDMSSTGYSPNNPRQQVSNYNLNIRLIASYTLPRRPSINIIRTPQLNEITPFIDGGLTYGINKAWSDALRLLKKNWELASYKGEGKFPIENSLGLPLANPPPPRDHDSLFTLGLGNPRGNENPFLLAFGMLWFRHHNWLARYLRDQHGNWSDEKVYNEARVLNIAVHQKIIMYDWLPLFLGECSGILGLNGTCEPLPNYTGYKSAIHPGITHVFQSAAMRIGHTLVPPGVFRRSKYNTLVCFFMAHVNKPGLRTCNTYWNSVVSDMSDFQSDIDKLLMGMASQIAEKEDNIITPDLRGSVFGPLDFSRRDLMALNIQRGRDHGLPDYNTARESFGLKKRVSFEEINPYNVLVNNIINRTNSPTYLCCMIFNVQQFSLTSLPFQLLQDLNDTHGGDISKMDVWTGGLLETLPTGPGELFRLIIRDQFLRIRDGDRFWFENTKNGRKDLNYHYKDVTTTSCFLLTPSELEFVRNTTIRDVILRTNPNLDPNFDIQQNPFQWLSSDPLALCPQPMQLNETDMEECTSPKTFDYFTGSEWSYALTFASFGLFTLGRSITKYQLRKKIKKWLKKMFKNSEQKNTAIGTSTTMECIFLKQGNHKHSIQVHNIKLKQCKIHLTTASGRQNLRTIDLTKSKDVLISTAYNRGRNTMFLRADKDTHDLVLKFNDAEERDSFIARCINFLHANNVPHKVNDMSLKQLMEKASTSQMRDEVLQKFFKAALSVSLKLEDGGKYEVLNNKEARKFIHIELSKKEFADYLKLKPTSMFVDQMFTTADTDGSGSISFREFLDIMVLFTKGKWGSMMDMVNASVATEQMDELVNTMLTTHGYQNKESLTLNDFQIIMNKYSNELSEASIKSLNPSWKVQYVRRKVQEQGRQFVIMPKSSFSHFGKILQTSQGFDTTQTSPITSYCHLVFRKSPAKLPRNKSRVEIKVNKKVFKAGKINSWIMALENYIQNYRLQIFWLTLYLLVLAGIFIERAYFYSVEREFAGLRRIAGYGVSITRGAASAMMFTYSSLLVTMCRNTITALRETFLHLYIPFDSAIIMHRIIAWLALTFTGMLTLLCNLHGNMFLKTMHILGHSLNIYSISTQTPGDLTCLFRDYWRPSHELPKFHYWCWQTITGITGVLLTLVVIKKHLVDVFYVPGIFILSIQPITVFEQFLKFPHSLTIRRYTFASDYSRRRVFQWFWWTHNLGYIFYFFMVLHGSGFLVQDPFFYYFFLGPAILYTLDKLYSLSRSKCEISVVYAELLPSDVTHLEFKRPVSFNYKAGQWVRIACLSQSPNEYHPFTLTSAPHEETLKVHIRAVGPWTMNLRNIYNPDVLRDSPYPKLYLDGPFGEGHQDWYKYDVAVLVGGGIGVTPFAAILKDLVNMAQSGVRIQCKKVRGMHFFVVYFMWVTRDQKQYEWLTDIIQEVETKDLNDLVDTHIFITQFPEKFDLRTTMLYICERQFQKVAGKSLFTGLRAVTHFGRPEFKSFFVSLTEEHPQVDKFGVFSCGPPPMTNEVDKTCSKLNKYEGPSFLHHFENF
uniref:NAD(P)H oxidase (H2O2-forming) n=1 Tax=Ciona savignyi TaxID=51511 RepID=H2Z325_CIOSA